MDPSHVDTVIVDGVVRKSSGWVLEDSTGLLDEARELGGRLALGH